MRDYVDIGPAPFDEDCAEAGSPDYWEKSKKECRAYKHQLEREFGPPPIGARIDVKNFPHDEFGIYQEVVCYFDDQIKGSLEYALKMKENTPVEWDEEAWEELFGGE